MRKEIPVQLDITCDFCGAEFSEFDKKSDLRITLSGNSVEHLVAVGNAYYNGQYDACHSCYMNLVDQIKEGQTNEL